MKSVKNIQEHGLVLPELDLVFEAGEAKEVSDEVAELLLGNPNFALATIVAPTPVQPRNKGKPAHTEPDDVFKIS